MALPIIEEPLYGQIQLETAPWASTFTWVDRTADLAGGFNYAEGGRVSPPGISDVQAGTLNATFKNAATIPAIGDAVRLRRNGTSEYFFTGFVQDVSQRIVFDDSVALVTPITLTTIRCSDWVGYLGQFQVVGVGGVQSDGTVLTSSYYAWPARIEALNKSIDNTMATDLISYTGTGTTLVQMGDTDVVATVAEHLDLITRTVLPTYWYGTHNLPTDNTTGRDNLVAMTENTPTASGYTFRDDLGAGANQLHYTEIDFENSNQNVANSVVISNRTRLEITDTEVTLVGGANETNFMIVANENVNGIPLGNTEKRTDATSITTYGVRQSEFSSSVGLSNGVIYNLAANPSLEYGDEGYSGTASQRVRRRRPAQEATPFTAYNGEWAVRSRETGSSSRMVIRFSGGESNGTPANPGTTYYLKVRVARGTPSPSNTRAYASIAWQNEAESQISSIDGTKVNLTNANEWYEVTVSGTAPAGTNRAVISTSHERSSGSFNSTDLVWSDAFYFSKTDGTYFDGDFPSTTSYVYGWTGEVGSSPSYAAPNTIDELADTFLAAYSTTSMRAARIRWNAQEDLTAVSSLTVGKSISLVYDGTTTTYRIIGIDGSVDPERYMIDYYLVKV
jgi:hypothetical protein